jgi:uncharacterized protein YqhQ
VVRGVVALAESLKIGFRALAFSANAQMDEDEEPIGGFTWGLTVALSLALAVGLFFVIPVGLTSLIKEQLGSAVLFWLVEGVVRTAIFIGYIAAISKMPDLRRVFEYHGAEHMVVSAYEHGDPLTVAGARAHSTRHPRCGTNFLLVVVAVSVVVFSFIPGPWGFAAKFLSRLALLPVVAGVAFEVLRLGGRPRARWLALPGYWLQALTTRPPSDDQIEVALRALREVLDMEGGARGVRQAG